MISRQQETNGQTERLVATVDKEPRHVAAEPGLEKAKRVFSFARVGLPEAAKLRRRESHLGDLTRTKVED